MGFINKYLTIKSDISIWDEGGGTDICVIFISSFNFLISLYLCNKLDETETFLDIIANCMAIPHSFSHIFHVVVGTQPCSEQNADVALLY